MRTRPKRPRRQGSARLARPDRKRQVRRRQFLRLRGLQDLDTQGELIRGGRKIDPVEAEIIREIFARYADGVSPRKIAFDLNGRAIPAPRGGAWSQSTLNGNRARGTGILNNEMYVGRIVWNRLRHAKEPETGRRRSRANADAAVVAKAAPELAIVSPELWDAVKVRQAALDTQGHPRGLRDADDAPAPFWSKQRPRYLFSVLMRCGVCGGGFSEDHRRAFRVLDGA